MGLLRKILGMDEMEKDDINTMLFRNKFSEFLPYRAYDPEKCTYHNMDNTTGFLWECIPLVNASDKIFDILEGMVNAGMPEGTVMQWTLYADPNIDPYINAYKKLKVHGGELAEKAVENVTNFFQEGTRGIDKIAGTPIRDFRLYVALKIPNNNKEHVNLLDMRDSVTEILKGIYLSPKLVEPKTLINLMGQIFNDEVPELNYDETKPINKQIILSETPIKSEWQKIQIGNKHARCMTVKQMVNQINELTLNYLAGDPWGVQGDSNQVTNPFLLTVNMIFQSMRQRLHTKCNFVLQQEAVGSFAPSLRRKQEEYMFATGELEKGTRFVRVMPVLWHFAPTEDESRESAARVKRIWQSRGFVTQEDRGILKVLLLSALPFGLFTDDNTLDYIDRDFVMHPKSAVRCLPLQVDFAGGGNPQCMFVGRKGQVIPFDLFSNQANNYNALICATSGAGKSFLTNNIAYNYYMAGGLLRIIDIGGSYKKLCDIVGGKFINFAPTSNLCLNPFTNIKDIDEEITAIGAIAAQMIFSSSRSAPSEEENTLIKAAIRVVYDEFGNQGDITKIYDVLREPTKSLEMLHELECGDDNSCIRDIKTVSTKLAMNLRSFTQYGEYGKWFNGPATLDIDTDSFTVLELEELRAQPELFQVVTLQVLNYVTGNLYLGDRSIPKLVIFDEAWQFFNNDSSMLAEIIVSGYRRARKYNASFTCITQSTLDIEIFGDIGQVILSNSASKFFLQSGDFEKAKTKNIIDYPPFTMAMLKTVSSPKPRYSEIFMDTPVGTGIARLLVDPFSYYLFTSDPRDNAKIDRLVKEGKTYSEAFEYLIAEQNKEKKAKLAA